MAGPVVSALVGALGAAFSAASRRGAALAQIGVHKDHVIRYETALKADKYLVVVHGTAAQLEKARLVLKDSKTTMVA